MPVPKSCLVETNPFQRECQLSKRLLLAVSTAFVVENQWSDVLGESSDRKQVATELRNMPYFVKKTLSDAAWSIHRHDNDTNTNRLNSTVVREMDINRVDFLVEDSMAVEAELMAAEAELNEVGLIT